MKTHYSCAELAGLNLPGYPTAKKNWIALVEREGWESRPRSGRGGGKEYTPPSPLLKQIHQRQTIVHDGATAKAVLVLRNQFRREVETERAAKTEAAYADVIGALTAKGQAKFDAHFDILLAWRNWHAERNTGGKMGRNESFKCFAEAYNAGRISVTEAVKARYTTLSPRSIQRWVLDNEQKGLVTFADRRAVKGRGQKSQIEQHPELEKALIAVLAEKSHVDSTHLTEVLNHARIDRASGEVLWPEISYYSVCRYRTKFEENHAQALLAATNPDAWKSKYLSSLGKLDADITRLNQRWEMDGTPADWELIDGRHTASVVIDIYSRRPRILFSKTPRTETNKALLRHCILDWGMLEIAKTDNGSDYVSREMVLFFEEMGIEHQRSAPFSPWEKGHVESFIKTYLHSILELLDAFIGHSVADRQAIEARRTFAEQLFKKNAVVKVDMTVAELQELTDAWVEGTYMMNKHSSLGMSPRERVAGWTGPVRRIENERALDLLLAKPVKKPPTISAKGIRYDNATFIHPELPIHAGKLADIRLDPTDLGRLVVYVDGKFLCIAECPERTGINRAEVAAHGRAKQKEFINTKRAEFRAAKKSLPMSTQDLVKDLVMSRAVKAGKVALLPKKADPHSTPALEQAARAAQAMATPQPSAAYLELMAQAQAAFNATQPKAPVLALPTAAALPPENPGVPINPLSSMSDAERYAYWLGLEATVKAGGVLDADWQQRFYTGFPKSSIFRAQAFLAEARKEDARHG